MSPADRHSEQEAYAGDTAIPWEAAPDISGAPDWVSQRTAAECRRVLESKSKSFALAARLLPSAQRDRAAVVYAYFRRIDDLIDESPKDARPQRLAALYKELDTVYRAECPRAAAPPPAASATAASATAPPAASATAPPALEVAAFRAIVRECGIPRIYPAELLAGMATDVQGVAFEDDEELLLYCHRAAGVVGLTMCHVLGVRDAAALPHAAHLGWAMQLTNIARDVAEDWQLGRRYLPAARFRAYGSAPPEPAPLVAVGPPTPFPAASIAVTSEVVRDLLALADAYYESGRRGLYALPLRASVSVDAASQIYQAIGEALARQQYDVTRGRAFVPGSSKARLAARAMRDSLRSRRRPRCTALRADKAREQSRHPLPTLDYAAIPRLTLPVPSTRSREPGGSRR